MTDSRHMAMSHIHRQSIFANSPNAVAEVVMIDNAAPG